MIKKEVIVLFFVFLFAFLFNLFWEVLHSFLYDWNVFPLKNEISFFIPTILRATLIDAIYILFIFLVNSFIRCGINWINIPKLRDYIIVITLGLLVSFFIELRAIYFGLWNYNKYMPLLFGIGVTPLIQLAIINVIVLLLLKKIYKSLI